jgi:starch synthase
MKILMAGSEMSPLARTGGLGDVLGAFPKELQDRGHDVSVVLPFYRVIRENPALSIKSTGVQTTLQVGAKRVDAEILECIAPNDVQVFLVRRDEYFDRSGLYGGDDGAYADNAERYVFFSKAVVELAKRMKPAPEVLHLHDWQAALVPVFVRDQQLRFRTVLTIHNIGYQGSFWAADFGLTNLPGQFFSASGIEFYGSVNFLKGGILHADAITTVSERYAREIQTPEGGFGLDVVMREHASHLSGILNGVDYEVWNPATDKWIAKKYKPSALAGKKTCRNALLAEFSLDKNPQGPVFAMITRLAGQKGIDILLPLLDRMLSDDVRLVILGEGESGYERDLIIACKKHRERFAFQRGFDDRHAHIIEAGADIVLIPSHYEPCGLTAMYSLKYGTVPVARASGGLHQIIRDQDPTTGAGNGFLFYDYSPEALWDCIGRARKFFGKAEAWKGLMQAGMECDFSWSRAAAEYEKVYSKIQAAAASRKSRKA